MGRTTIGFAAGVSETQIKVAQANTRNAVLVDGGQELIKTTYRGGRGFRCGEVLHQSSSSGFWLWVGCEGAASQKSRQGWNMGPKMQSEGRFR